jgi:hypothetical protein
MRLEGGVAEAVDNDDDKKTLQGTQVAEVRRTGCFPLRTQVCQ